MADERKPTMWEQVTGLGDYCDLCVLNREARRKVVIKGTWQACPHCDRIEPSPRPVLAVGLG